jgi:hypothetical protein
LGLNLNFGPDRWLEMAQATAVAIDAVLSMTMAAANQRDTSPEAFSNLLYLIRRSVDDPARAKAYLDVADQVLIVSFRQACVTPSESCC